MDGDKSGSLSRDEYLKEMLINLGLVDRLLVKTLLDEFDRLDADGSGELTKDDLVQALREERGFKTEEPPLVQEEEERKPIKLSKSLFGCLFVFVSLGSSN